MTAEDYRSARLEQLKADNQALLRLMLQIRQDAGLIHHSLATLPQALRQRRCQTVTITPRTIGQAITTANAYQKAARAYRDWTLCPSPELLATAQRKRDLYHDHRAALIAACEADR